MKKCYGRVECVDLYNSCRRFAKRIYVSMPDEETRIVVLNKLLSKHGRPLSFQEIDELARFVT